MTSKLTLVSLCFILIGCGVVKIMTVPKGSATGVILKTDIVRMIDTYQEAVQLSGLLPVLLMIKGASL